MNAEAAMSEYSEEERAILRWVGNNIRSLRRMRGYSQESFADYVGLHRTYMGGVERGERNLSVLNIVKIARGLGISPGELFDEEKKSGD